MPSKQVPPEISEYFRQLGKENGSIGGKAAADNMTAAERKERARKAAKASAAVRSKKAKAASRSAAKKAGKKTAGTKAIE